MIYLVNISTIILAVVFTLVISTEKHKIKTAIFLVLTGLVFHIIEAYLSYTAGKCMLPESPDILNTIDECIDYESGVMLYAQAMIIAGFTVLFVCYFFAKQRNQ